MRPESGVLRYYLAILIVTLTTDFGTRDGFVGAMKGVLATRAPTAHIVDISHDVPPQDLRHAVFTLRQSVAHFPKGSIHVVVVDPGVGGDRKAVVVDDGRHLFVGPDNGILPGVVRAPFSAWEISSPVFMRDEVSATFHGRDVFAPAAAALACGAAPSAAGSPVELWVGDGMGDGEPTVVHVDRFGNLITSIDPPTGPIRLVIAGHELGGVKTTFSSVAPGELLAYVGSSGAIEIAVRDGDASRLLGVSRGEPIKVVAVSEDE
jgi:S-adenosylmethionine hydrolase